MPLEKIEREEALGGFRHVVTRRTDDAVDINEKNEGILAGLGIECTRDANS
jgi:hypothetical protein